MIHIKKIIYFIATSSFTLVVLLTLVLFFYAAFFFEPPSVKRKIEMPSHIQSKKIPSKRIKKIETPKIKEVIDYIKSQKGCYFSRITGSGSACIGIFSNMRNAIYAKKLIKINKR